MADRQLASMSASGVLLRPIRVVGRSLGLQLIGLVVDLCLDDLSPGSWLERHLRPLTLGIDRPSRQLAAWLRHRLLRLCLIDALFEFIAVLRGCRLRLTSCQRRSRWS
jgi:hypothetical protein